MNRYLNSALACGIILFASAAVAAPTNSGTITTTVTTSETNSFMGMSNKTPPNARAASSQGTRTETTTSSVDVHGPKRQVDHYVAGDSETCHNCSFSEPYNVSTEVTDLPGANR